MGYAYINWAAVLVATIAAFAVGALWHGPVFGRQWMKLMSFTPASIKKMKLTPAKAMTLGFFSTLLMAYVLAYLLSWLGATSAALGLMIAAKIWLGIEVPLILGGFLWEGRSFQLFAFNACYRLVEIMVMAGIISAW